MRFILSFIVLILVSASGIAQDKRPGDWDKKRSQIEAIKVAFLTDRLNLTPDEAQKFWPVYNSYQREMDGLMGQRWRNREANKENPEKALTTDLALDRRVLDTKMRYQEAFQRVVSAQKVLALYNAEKDFREYLMKHLHSRDGKK